MLGGVRFLARGGCKSEEAGAPVQRCVRPGAAVSRMIYTSSSELPPPRTETLSAAAAPPLLPPQDARRLHLVRATPTSGHAWTVSTRGRGQRGHRRTATHRAGWVVPSHPRHVPVRAPSGGRNFGVGGQTTSLAVVGPGYWRGLCVLCM